MMMMMMIIIIEAFPFRSHGAETGKMGLSLVITGFKDAEPNGMGRKKRRNLCCL